MTGPGAGVPTITLAGGQVTYQYPEARQVVGGYAFSTVPVVLNAYPPNLGAPPADLQRYRWSSSIYDFQPADYGNLSYLDLIVNIGLGSQIRESAIAGMQAIAPYVSEAIAHVPLHQTFWDLPAPHVNNPPNPSPAWWMWRAATLLDSVPDVGPAITYKTLHHKRPWLFPLLDNLTLALFPLGQSWQIIHDDLITQTSIFEELEQWLADQAAAHSLFPITRLRIHDILLWCHVSGERAAAGQAGRNLGY